MFIYGIGSSVIDYVMSDIPIYSQIVNFDILINHEPNLSHMHLILTLNFVMHNSALEEKSNNQKHLIFDKNKDDIFVKHLKNELNVLLNNDNIEKTIL